MESSVWEGFDLLWPRVVPDLFGRVQALGLVGDQTCSGLQLTFQQQFLRRDEYRRVLTV